MMPLMMSWMGKAHRQRSPTRSDQVRPKKLPVAGFDFDGQAAAQTKLF